MDARVHVDERQRLLAGDVRVILPGRQSLDMPKPVDVGAAVLVGPDEAGRGKDHDPQQLSAGGSMRHG
jgi:hypothetical protein